MDRKLDNIGVKSFPSIITHTETPHADNCVSEQYNNLLSRIINSTETHRGSLLLDKKTSLFLEADVYTDNWGEICNRSAKELTSIGPIDLVLPMAVIHKALHDQKPLYLHQEQLKKSFAQDPYFKKQIPIYIYCLPIMNGVIFQGLLYLETSDPDYIHTTEFESKLNLWSDQASLTLENAKKILMLQESYKRKTQELNIARKKGRSRNLTRIQFLADMGHEIRAPLNTIMGFSQLMMKKGNQHQLPQSFNHYLENICSSGYQLTELLENILAYSHIDSGKLELKKETINLKLLIRSIFHTTKFEAERNNIKLNYNYDDLLPNYIYSDRSAISQTLTTLVKQAVKRSTAGDSVLINSYMEPNNLVVQVKDNGTTMPLKPQIGGINTLNDEDPEPLSRLEDQSFGMAVTRKIVETLNGEIRLTQEPQFRSVFSVRIPCSIPESFGNDHLFTGKPTCLRNDANILIVKGKAFITETLESMLKDLGVPSVTTDGFLQNSKNSEDFNPTLVLVSLPDKLTEDEKQKLASQIKKSPYANKVPIIIVLAKNERPYWEHIKYWKPDAIIQEPLNFSKLTGVLQQHLPGDQLSSDLVLPDQGLEKKSHSEALKSPPLPADLSRVMKIEFTTLASIPIYKGRTLMTQLRQMMKNIDGFSTPYTAILRKLELALFDGNDQLVVNLINEAQNFK